MRCTVHWRLLKWRYWLLHWLRREARLRRRGPFRLLQKKLRRRQRAVALLHKPLVIRSPQVYGRAQYPRSRNHTARRFGYRFTGFSYERAANQKHQTVMIVTSRCQ
jgi:hypothetical protein